MNAAIHAFRLGAVGILALCSLILPATHISAEQITLTSTKLPNGVRLTCIQVPDSHNIAMYSILPIGLAADDANRAQWSHLVEHLVVRTTMPNDMTHGNAETLAGQMHLDYYGPVESWREGLSHHKRWLVGIPFTETTLKAEAPRANGEADSTARNLASG